MGSFCQTCGVTQLPIEEGDPVVAFLIAHKPSYSAYDFSGNTSPGAHWRVVSLPIYGQYDSYGGVEPDELQSAHAGALVLDELGVTLGRLFEMARDRDELPMVQLMPERAEADLQVMMMHQEVFDHLSSQSFSPITDEPVSYGAEVDRTLDLLDFAAELHAEQMARLGVEARGQIEFGSMSMIDFEWRERRPDQGEPPYILRYFAPGEGRSSDFGLAMALRNKVRDLMNAGDRDTAKAMLAEALKLTMLDEQMLDLRRHWAPQSGLGAQDPLLERHQALAGLAVAHCERKKAEWDSEFGEPQIGM